MIPVFVPHWRRITATPAAFYGCISRLQCSDDLVHGLVEGEAKDLDKEVDGIACFVLFRPAPVGVFEDETGMSGQFKVARLSFDELEAAPLKQWNERGDSSGPDLFAGPPMGGRTSR
jgi:hypothetical protein